MGVTRPPRVSCGASVTTPHSAFHSLRFSVGESSVDQEFADVEADAARADDGHRLADRLAEDGLGVGQHHRMVDAGDVGQARGDAGGEHHLVETGQLVDRGAGAQPHLDVVLVEHSGVVADGLGELLLAGNPSRQVELAADRACPPRTA